MPIAARRVFAPAPHAHNPALHPSPLPKVEVWDALVEEFFGFGGGGGQDEGAGAGGGEIEGFEECVGLLGACEGDAGAVGREDGCC